MEIIPHAGRHIVLDPSKHTKNNNPNEIPLRPNNAFGGSIITTKTRINENMFISQSLFMTTRKFNLFRIYKYFFA
jgi:hypothetical protein